MSKANWIAALIVGVLGGVGIGSYATWKVATLGLTSYELSDIAHFSAYADLQRSRGTPEAYETSLKELLASIDARERNRSGLFSEHLYAVDRALTYARLSGLAKRRGDARASAEYETLAEAQCPKTGWSRCSAADIVEFADRLDRNTVWASPKADNPHAAN